MLENLKSYQLKINFVDSENLERNYSQSCQDLFVLMCLDGKKNGTFLDLGCYHPTEINNTYLLESRYGWSGVSVDTDTSMTSLYGERVLTQVYNEDCIQIDFDKIKNNFNSNHIDYLSLDLDPAEVTLQCLKRIPFNEIEFSVITYEHDRYRFGDSCRNESREYLKNLGYEIICSDVKNCGHEYEDWYYNPKYVSYDRIKELNYSSTPWMEILFQNN